LGNELALSIAQSGLFFLLGKGDGQKKGLELKASKNY
jgi:hypothetical protein